MYKKLLSLGLAIILVACGDGNNTVESTPIFARESVITASVGNTDSLSAEALAFAKSPSIARYATQRDANTTPFMSDILGKAQINGVSIDQLFAWGEANFPKLLTSHELNGYWNGYTYRYYPASNTYVGIDTNNVVWIMGPDSTNGVLVKLAPASDYVGQVNAWIAAVTAPKVSTGLVGLLNSMSTGSTYVSQPTVTVSVGGGGGTASTPVVPPVVVSPPVATPAAAPVATPVIPAPVIVPTPVVTPVVTPPVVTPVVAPVIVPAPVVTPVVTPPVANVFSWTPTVTITTKFFDLLGAWWNGNMFFADLNGDGIEEIIIAGRMSQPATAATWQFTRMHILGWNTGSLAMEDSQWFTNNNDNLIFGTEPSIKFADFNGDGRRDIWIAPSADMMLFGPGTVYINQGNNQLKRSDLNIGQIWAHDSAVGDFNKDGKDDIIVVGLNGNQAIALGQSDGTFKITTGSTGLSAAGMAAGDFLGNGTTTVILTDAFMEGNQTNGLYQVMLSGGVSGGSGSVGSSSASGSGSFQGGGALMIPANPVATLTLNRISKLPPNRFYLPKWSGYSVLTPGHMPSTVRAVPIDFNRDGQLDVVLLTMAQNGTIYSEVQFLQNNGGGNFTDVTDTVLQNYNSLHTQSSYSPRLIDINRDGVLDIWLSNSDGDGAEDSNVVLMGNASGNYTATYASAFTADRTFVGGNPAPVQAVRGPDQNLWLLTLNWSMSSLNVQINAKKIGLNLSSLPN